MTEKKDELLDALTQDEWDQWVGKHLRNIEWHAEIIEQEIRRLLDIPKWETRALEHVSKCELLVGAVLTKIAKARQDLGGRQPNAH